jgi:hypothetical protein
MVGTSPTMTIKRFDSIIVGTALDGQVAVEIDILDGQHA